MQRWIDCLTFFDYPDAIRDRAYEIVGRLAVLKCRPSSTGAAAVMIACEDKGVEFLPQRAEAVLQALNYRKEKWGLRSGSHGQLFMQNVREKVKEWRSRPA